MDKRFTTKTIHEIRDHDLNDLIKETYGLDDFNGMDESPNDSTHSYKVEKSENKYPRTNETFTTEMRESLITYSQENAAKIIKAGFCEHYSLGDVLDDMCDKGIIEEGEYLVSVCW